MENNTQLLQLGALVWGLTEVFKNLVPAKIGSQFAPLVAVILGGLSNVYLNGYSPENVLYGLALGLAATGLYKAGKVMMLGEK